MKEKENYTLTLLQRATATRDLIKQEISISTAINIKFLGVKESK